jgi:environmental stress-induced protein Ves
VDHRLDVPHEPFAFSGDDAIDCTLLGGASNDFNVMTRRGQWRADVQVLDHASAIEAAPHGVLLALARRVAVEREACREARACTGPTRRSRRGRPRPPRERRRAAGRRSASCRRNLQKRKK